MTTVTSNITSHPVLPLNQKQTELTKQHTRAETAVNRRYVWMATLNIATSILLSIILIGSVPIGTLLVGHVPRIAYTLATWAWIAIIPFSVTMIAAIAGIAKEDNDRARTVFNATTTAALIMALSIFAVAVSFAIHLSLFITIPLIAIPLGVAVIYGAYQLEADCMQEDFEKSLAVASDSAKEQQIIELGSPTYRVSSLDAATAVSDKPSSQPLSPLSTPTNGVTKTSLRSG